MKIVVVGGCGHVGLPLSVALANTSHSVVAFDISESAVQSVHSGHAPFWEPGLDLALKSALDKGFRADMSADSIIDADGLLELL